MKISFLIAICIFSLNAIAQHNKGADVTDVFKITILNPGISYEKRISKFQTLTGQVFMNTSAVVESSGYGTQYSIYFDPAVLIQYRYYYNLLKREDQGKRTQMNSGNYIAASWQTVFSDMRLSNRFVDELGRRAVNTVAVLWGLQRNYKKRLSLDLNLGIGYMFAKSTTLFYDYLNGVSIPSSTNYGSVTLAGQFNIGFWLGKQ